MTLTAYIAATHLAIALAASTGDAPSESPKEPTAIDTTALQAPTAIALDSERGAIMLEGVQRVLDSELGARDRRSLGQKVLSERRVKIYEGHFDGAVAIATVNVELRVADPTQPRTISGVFTLTASGVLEAIVVAPASRPEQFELGGLGDIDGDGRDDLHLWSRSADAEQLQRITWDGTTPKVELETPEYEEGC